MVNIFINYRRDDDRSAAARLRDRLINAFGADSVFMDVDNLKAGQRFDTELTKVLEKTQIFLCVIGKRWLALLRERHIAGERDFVRKEIEAALQRQILLIPVLIDGAALPQASELPPDISDLVLHQKHNITPGRFGRDVEDLIRSMQGASTSLAATGSENVRQRHSSLRGLRRVGIVLSIAWALFGYVYKNSSEIALWNEAYQLKYKLCKDIKEMNHARKVEAWTIKNNKEGKILGSPGYWDGYPDIDLQPCFEEGSSYAAVMHPYGFENALAFALLPIPFAWLAAYIVIAVGRWIRRGFA